MAKRGGSPRTLFFFSAAPAQESLSADLSTGRVLRRTLLYGRGESANQVINMVEKKEKKGEMTVEEAGHLGGEKGGHKGGERTAETHGREFYEEIGHKGGQKVKRLIEEGEKAEKEEKK